MRFPARCLLVPAVVLMFLAGFASFSHAAPPISTGKAGPHKLKFAPDTLILKPKPGVTQAKIGRLHAQHGAKQGKVYTQMGNLQVVHLPKGSDVERMVEKYKKSALVEYAEPDYIIPLRQIAPPPNDPYYVDGSQWALTNIQTGNAPDGEHPETTCVAGSDIDAREGWAIRTDAPNVVVAIVDSGVDYTHPDLAPNMWTNVNEVVGDANSDGRPGIAGVDDDGDGKIDEDSSGRDCQDPYWNNDLVNDDDENGYADDIRGIATQRYTDPNPQDWLGHGSHCAGIVGARGNNGIGVTGVAWNVKIMPVCLVDFSETYYIEGIDYAVRMGADIINASWGWYGYPIQGVYDAIVFARDHGVLFVNAAGNDSSDCDVTDVYPGEYDLDNMVHVGAMDCSDSLAWWSNYGAEMVDICAPGEDIYSTWPGSDYLVETGTSMAAPMVCGALALAKAQFPGESYVKLKCRLLASVDVLPCLVNRCATAGRLNLGRLLSDPIPDFCVLPTMEMIATGGAGGPVTPSHKTYEMTNTGSTSINWSATVGGNWVTVSPASGSVAAGQTITLTVTIAPGAKDFPFGVYTDTVTITDQTHSQSTTRSVTLTTGPVFVAGDTGDDHNSGFSWTDAKETIQAGLDEAKRIGKKMVWVKAGVYSAKDPWSTSVSLRDGHNGIALYGGFTGSEALLGERPAFPRPSTDPFETAIDGTDVYSAPVYIYACPDTDTRLDGFTIRNGEYGGVYCTSSNATITNCTITGCENFEEGGGIRCTGSSPTIVNNKITGNSNTHGGGGIYLSSCGGSVSCNIISGNSATVGAGIFRIYSSSTISGNVICGNTATNGDGGGIRCQQDSASNITANTIALNSCTGNGAGIYATDCTGLGIRDNIIASNTGSYGIYLNSCTQTLGYNDVWSHTPSGYYGVTPPPTDISVDPEFVNAAQGDFHLQQTSDCINAGLNTAPGLPAQDIDGDTRILNGTVDIGADEDCTSVPVATPTISPASGLYSSPIEVEILCATPGAGIRFTRDGSAPTLTTGEPYVGKFMLDTPTPIRAKAWKSPQPESGIAQADYDFKVSDPEFSPAPGTYQQSVQVSISSDTPDAQIRYTINAGDPIESSTLYTGPFTVSTDATVRAKAWRSGMAASDVAEAQYLIKIATPVISPPSGTYNSAQTVTIECATTGAEIRYTVNDPNLTQSSTLYTGPFTVSTNATVRARAFKTGMLESDIATADYVIDIPVNAKFVDHDAPGPTHDGLSWNTAFLTVQEGLNAATAGDEVWVAAGAYTGHVTLKNGVALYGGFAGNEVTRDARDWRNLTTCLSGSGVGNVVSAVNATNPNTRLDGFTISGGNLNCERDEYDMGAGIFFYGCSITIANNTITDNITGAEWSFCFGGGIGCGDSDVIITNNIITDNHAYSGGGIYLSGAVTGVISNNIIAGNTAVYSGGGICSWTSTPVIVNNTLVGNTADWEGGGIYCEGTSAPAILNNIVASGSSGIYAYDDCAIPTLDYNDVYGNAGYQYSPNLTPGPGSISVAPEFADQSAGNYHLMATSQCIDHGSDSAPSLPATDMDGQSRISGAHVDIGADEFLPPAATTVYVKPQGNDAYDGLSWNTAKRTIQAALNISTAEGEVWVAAGGYQEIVHLRNGVALYGGFTGVETNRDARNPRANDTSIIGDTYTTVVRVFDCPHSNTRIDGFTITDGGDDLEHGGIGGGAGIYCSNSTITIANNRLLNNHASVFWIDPGGAIACSNSTAYVSRNWIENNSAFYGGGIYAGGTDGYIADNVIISNSGEDGGGIHIMDSQMLVTSNTLVGNTATDGGGISWGGNPASNTISNNIIVGCSSGIYAGSPAPPMTYNDVYGNTDYDYSPGLTPGVGSISANPIFVNQAAGDYRLVSYSPCVDACPLGGDVDYNGDPRGVDGNGDGTHLDDIGAFECQAGTSQVSTPTFTPDGGTYASARNVVMGCATPDATIYYTTNGTTPSPTNGTVYTTPVLVDHTLTLKALATKSGYLPSNVKSANYVISVVAGTKFVDQDAPGPTHNGLTWGTAFLTVQQGMDASAAGNEVWVAAHSYLESISVPDGVALYGGFVGTETTRDQRDWKTNVTYLDGADTDTVVRIIDAMDPRTRVDGFTIQNGLGSLDFGAGVHCAGSQPTITNNVIRDNYATDNTMPEAKAGGICAESSAVTITNNTIRNNSSDGTGGGIWLIDSSGLIANNIVYQNSAFYDAGIGCWDSTSIRIVNNTVVANSAVPLWNSSGGMCAGISCGAGAEISNNIVAWNEAFFEISGICAPASTVLHNNNVYGNMGGCDPSDYNGCTPDPESISYDPMFVNPAAGNLHIQPDSPCVGNGRNEAVGPAWVDIDGQPRVQPTGGTVDIGADESDTPVVSQIYYVKPNGNNANSGLSWAAAKQTIQAGLDVAQTNDEVWVAKGEYTQNITLENGVALYGGFAGSETALAARNWRVNRTAILGNGWQTVVTVADAPHWKTRIDGFAIEGGGQDHEHGTGGNAGGINCTDSTITVANNRFYNNRAESIIMDNGGAIGCSNSNVTISGNWIYDNFGWFGGGIYAYSCTGNVVNNIIAENGSSYGGGMYLDTSNITVEHNTLVGNDAYTSGGGIQCEGSATATIRNNIVAFGSSGIFRGGYHPYLDYNDVYGNTSGNYGPDISNPGTGSISVDPQLVNRSAADYHLLGGSPCIDKCLDGLLSDYDGKPAPVDGDGNGDAKFDMGACEYQPGYAPLRLTVANGAAVEVNGLSVTACFLDADSSGVHWVYVESADRASGIRVRTPNSFSVGTLVNVKGTMQTDAVNGERYVNADAGYPQASGGTLLISSLGMRNQWIGGAASGPIPVIKDGFGFYNVGLLVQSWGTVNYVNSVGRYFYIDDGSYLYDGNGFAVGLRVTVPAGVSMPTVGQYVKVTGVSGAVKIGVNYVRAIRVRTAADITTVTDWLQDPVGITTSEWNMLALPGIPRYPWAESIFVACSGNPDIVLDGNLKRWDLWAQDWIYLNSCGGGFSCLVGEGYGLYIPPGGSTCYNYERTPVSGDQLISLPRGGLDMVSLVGDPFDYDRPWSSMKVTDGISVMSLPDAVSVGWVNYVAYWWDDFTWAEVTDLQTGYMARRTGYRINPSANNLALIVPAQ